MPTIRSILEQANTTFDGVLNELTPGKFAKIPLDVQRQGELLRTFARAFDAKFGKSEDIPTDNEIVTLCNKVANTAGSQGAVLTTLVHKYIFSKIPADQPRQARGDVLEPEAIAAQRTALTEALEREIAAKRDAQVQLLARELEAARAAQKQLLDKEFEQNSKQQNELLAAEAETRRKLVTRELEQTAAAAAAAHQQTLKTMKDEIAETQASREQANRALAEIVAALGPLRQELSQTREHLAAQRQALFGAYTQDLATKFDERHRELNAGLSVIFNGIEALLGEFAGNLAADFGKVNQEALRKANEAEAAFLSQAHSRVADIHAPSFAGAAGEILKSTKPERDGEKPVNIFETIYETHNLRVSQTDKEADVKVSAMLALNEIHSYAELLTFTQVGLCVLSASKTELALFQRRCKDLGINNKIHSGRYKMKRDSSVSGVGQGDGGVSSDVKTSGAGAGDQTAAGDIKTAGNALTTAALRKAAAQSSEPPQYTDFSQIDFDLLEKNDKWGSTYLRRYVNKLVSEGIESLDDPRNVERAGTFPSSLDTRKNRHGVPRAVEELKRLGVIKGNHPHILRAEFIQRFQKTKEWVAAAKDRSKVVAYRATGDSVIRSKRLDF